MTLTNPKPAGWSTGEILTSAQANSIGTQLPYAVDGNAGGTYAPSDPIIIGGDGLTVTGALTASGASNYPALSPTRTLTGIISMAPIDNVLSGAAPAWGQTLSIGATFRGWIQNSVSGPHEIVFHISPPVGATLKTVTLYIDGDGTTAGAGHGALPANMPIVRLASYVNSTGTESTIASQADTAANVGAYETYHAITLSGLSTVVASGTSYSVVLVGETGANAANDCLVVYAGEYTYEATDIRPHY